MIDANTVEPMPERDTDDPFWSSRDVLLHIRDYARARRVSPWATFGVALADAMTTIPAAVTLPKLIGGRAAPNLFVALVGPSGAGKGAAEAAARDAIYIGWHNVPIVPLGSGEGIARTFRPVGTDKDAPNPVTAAIFSAPEIDTLSALTARQGSTLSSELRKLYDGGILGFANAGKDTRTTVAAHSYRACLIAGVQPLRSGPLLDAADGGLPQRFCWLPTADPDAPTDLPDSPSERWKINPPRWTAQGKGHLSVVDGMTEIAVPESARRTIDAHRLAVLRQDPNVDPLDGHALLCRLKVAAGLMALEDRTEVTTEDWSLAGFVMDVSAYTREQCRHALTAQARTTNTAKAHAAAEREEIISDRKVQRCKDGILRRLDRHGAPIQQRELYRGLKSDIRDNFDAAAMELITEGHITAGHDGRAPTYALSTWTNQSTPPDQAKHHVDPNGHVDPSGTRRRRRTRGRKRQPQQTDGAAS